MMMMMMWMLLMTVLVVRLVSHDARYHLSQTTSPMLMFGTDVTYQVRPQLF